MIRKDQFLLTFYSVVSSDVVTAFDILYPLLMRLDLSDFDKASLDICYNYRFRPDRFSNICFISAFIEHVITTYPTLSSLLDFHPSLSDAFLSNLLTFNFILNECKKNYSN